METKKHIVKESKVNDSRIVVIRIKGKTKLRKEIRDTFKILNLHKKFSCAVLSNNSSTKGMINKVKDYVTFGDISAETFKILSEKKGGKAKGKNKVNFRLNPPKGGFERKGTKVAFKVGGVLGDRKEKINDLIKRML